MSRDASVNLEWAGGHHLFKLGIGELEKLDDLCDAGPAFMAQALASGTWRTKYVVETVRWGLVGGGMDVVEANRLIKTFIDGTPLMQHSITAQAVLMACLVGADEGTKPDTESPNLEAVNPSQEEN